MYHDVDWQAVNAHATATLATFLRAQGVPVGDEFAATFRAARERGWKLADETGIEHTLAEALGETLTELGHLPLDDLLPRAVEEFLREPDTHWLGYPDALETLRILAARGLRLGIFSNADDAGLVQRAAVRLGLSPYLDPVVSSATAPRYRKPDARALHLIADAWHIAPSEIVMVGDAPRYDILGGHRAGMRAILVDRGDNFWWQKIPDDQTSDPAMHADRIVHALAELPSTIEILQTL